MEEKKRKQDQPEQLLGQISYDEYVHLSFKPEIEGSSFSWFYVCGNCHSQIKWKEQRCPVCKAGVDWNV